MQNTQKRKQMKKGRQPKEIRTRKKWEADRPSKSTAAKGRDK